MVSRRKASASVSAPRCWRGSPGSRVPPRRGQALMLPWLVKPQRDSACRPAATASSRSAIPFSQRRALVKVVPRIVPVPCSAPVHSSASTHSAQSPHLRPPSPKPPIPATMTSTYSMALARPPSVYCGRAASVRSRRHLIWGGALSGAQLGRGDGSPAGQAWSGAAPRGAAHLSLAVGR